MTPILLPNLPDPIEADMPMAGDTLRDVLRWSRGYRKRCLDELALRRERGAA